MRPIDEVGANQFIEGKIEEYHAELERILKADVMTFFGPLFPPVDDVIRGCIEQVRTDSKRKKLAVVLETNGGSPEVVQRIVNTLRRHYQRVEFIIPNHAMSAGTVMVLSGDAIHMDYYSVLGPIDPQIRSRDGKWLPALGYLVKFEELLAKADSDRGLNTAEMGLLLKAFDQAELFQIEQARNLSITLLKEWLVKYKFKNWRVTQTRRLRVTKKMRMERAEQIAKILNDPERWHTHGRGISMEILKRDLKLDIDDFGENKQLARTVKEYYGLLADFIRKIGFSYVIQARGVFVPIM